MYVETTIAMFSAYLFWFALSKITTPGVIGTSSALIALSGILSTFATLGVSGGVNRFLGKSLRSEDSREDSKSYVKASLLITSVGIVCSITVTMIFRSWLYTSFDFDLIILSNLLIVTAPISTLFRAILIATMKTRILPVASIISAVIKIALSVILIFIGTGAFGVVLGYASYLVCIAILLAFPIYRTIFAGPYQNVKGSFSRYLKDVLTAGMATWIPGLIAGIGSQLGTIIVLGTQGAAQAGFYFIAFSITTGISTIMSVLSSITYPALSGMSDGRKRLAWRVIKMNLVIGVPLSSSIMLYAKEVMQLFGREYGIGSSSLEILLLSTFPTAILSGVTTLVYSYGNYRQVLTIGIATNISRTILYFVLVPIFYGGVGGALSYTIGAVIGFAVSVIMSMQIGLRMRWKTLVPIFLAPTGVAFLLNYYGVNYIAGILITIILSYIIYLKLRIIDQPDLEDIQGTLPNTIINPLVKVFNVFGKKNGS